MTDTLRWLTPDELDLWYASERRQLEGNGDGGRWFTVHLVETAGARFSAERLADSRAAAARPLDAPGWLRVLGAFCDGALVGSADLAGGSAATDLHRCTLGVGLDVAHRGRGLGRRVMREVITWARAAGLAWMDLGVFAGNDPAERLYRSLGFVEVGRVPDRFRFRGTPATEILMTLALAAS